MIDIAQSLATARSLQMAGDVRQAECQYRKILTAEPNHADARDLLGVALCQSGRHAEAIAEITRAIELNGSNATYHNHLGAAHVAAGHALEAEQAYRAALALNPRDPLIHFNLAVLLRKHNSNAAAIEHYREAVRLQPDFAQAHFNLGNLLLGQDDLAEAAVHYRQAVQADPSHVKAWSNLGTVARLQRQFDEAAECFDRAISVQPDFAEARYNRSQIWLIQGNFARGWPEFEWRLECTNQSWPRFSQPRWDGSHPDGRTILLYTEQGCGDTMHFIRYVPLVQRLGSRVLVAAPALLVPLLRQAGIENLFSEWAELPPFDVHASLLSLPGIFRTTLDTIPADVPYLHADPKLVQRWRPAVERFDGFKVGINWQGSPTNVFDRFRSIPLVEFAPVARVPGVQLISLQQIYGTQQLDQLRGRFDVAVLPDDPGTAAGAFMDNAAIMRNLDLVITCDTATAHLAGGLGVPVWVLLSCATDWRWLLDRDDSPWYPTMRLFRQTRLGHWSDVFERIAAQLQAMLETNGQPP